MDERGVLRILSDTGAVVEGHFVYTSGRHGAVYVNKDAVYPHTEQTSLLCRAIAEQFVDDGVEVVLAPALGGIILSQWVAYHLTQMAGREVLGVYAEKLDTGNNVGLFARLFQRVARRLAGLTGWKRLKVYAGKAQGDSHGFVIRRGYDKLLPGRNVLVVEDLLTTGGSARKVVEVARAHGGRVVGLGVLCNRGSVGPENVASVPRLAALANVTLESWAEGDCPLCRRGVPINTEVGKGREFLERRR